MFSVCSEVVIGPASVYWFQNIIKIQLLISFAAEKLQNNMLHVSHLDCVEALSCAG